MNGERGTIESHLNELLEAAGLSKTSFAKEQNYNVHSLTVISTIPSLD